MSGSDISDGLRCESVSKTWLDPDEFRGLIGRPCRLFSYRGGASSKPLMQPPTGMRSDSRGSRYESIVLTPPDDLGCGGHDENSDPSGSVVSSGNRKCLVKFVDRSGGLRLGDANGLSWALWSSSSGAPAEDAMLSDLVGQTLGDDSMLAIDNIKWCISSILTLRSPFSLLCMSSTLSAMGSIVFSRRERERL